MKSFVQTEHHFPDHAMIFTLSKRDSYFYERMILPAFEKCEDPARQQAALQETVEQIRPELENCTVYCFRYDIHRAQWQIGVSHPSLPAVNPGEVLFDEPLIRGFQSSREQNPML